MLFKISFFWECEIITRCLQPITRCLLPVQTHATVNRPHLTEQKKTKTNPTIFSLTDELNQNLEHTLYDNSKKLEEKLVKTLLVTTRVDCAMLIKGSFWKRERIKPV